MTKAGAAACRSSGGMHRIFARFAAVPAALALLAALWAMPAFADPRDFNVVNGSSIVLTHVFVSPSDTQEWGEDIMGRDVLSPAETVNVTFGKFDGNSCLYDVKVIGQGGQIGADQTSKFSSHRVSYSHAEVLLGCDNR